MRMIRRKTAALNNDERSKLCVPQGARKPACRRAMPHTSLISSVLAEYHDRDGPSHCTMFWSVSQIKSFPRRPHSPPCRVIAA